MAAERLTGNLGKKLREARERRGVSLRQIADRTKIAVSVLEGLERNDISRLPGGIFGRAFVRSFAAEIGLDPEATIEEFMGQFPQDSVTVGHPRSEQSGDKATLDSDRRMASTLLRLLAMSIPVAIAVMYFSTVGRPARPAVIDQAVAPQQPGAEPVPAVPAGDRLTV